MAPSKKNLKGTKKFEQKHLKGVLERRKSSAKVKQRIQVQAKQKAKRAKDAEFHKGDKAGKDGRTNGKRPGAKVGEMTVDDFFQGGFEILDKGKAGKKPAGKLGKRKRGEPQVGESASDDSDIDMPSGGGAVDEGESDKDSDAEDEGPVGMTQAALDALAEDDPEFYRYLKENDAEALDFDENADLAEIDELSSSEEEEEQPKKKRKQDKQEAAHDGYSNDDELTKSMVARWKRSMAEKHSLRAARQVVLAFRSAAHLNEKDDDKPQRYTINDPEVFHDILVVALKQIPEVLQHHVPVKESAAHKTYVLTETRKFKTLSVLTKSFTASILHLLATLSDDGTLKLTLSALTPLLPYLLLFRKLLKHLIKTVVDFWAQASSSEPTRITAFLVLRRLVVIGDKGIREAVLKAAYQGLIQGSRMTNVNTMQGINLMKNSAAELWGIDQNIGYTTAFAFIRQLAIHLRNSILHNQNESYKKVYNWQYVHSLDFWSCVLAEHCSPLKEAEAGKESQLRLLIYPLVQVTLGAMRLIPTAAFFPLRFQLVRSLLRVSRATGTYIPLASALIEVLNSAEMKKPSKSSTLKQLDFSVAYKAPKSYLRTNVYQTGVGEQVTELFSEYFVLWSTNIAFPEFSLPVVIMLKRWLKEARNKKGGNKNGKIIANLVLVVQKLEANGRFIEERRAKVDFAPKDRAQVDAFLKDFGWENTPMGAFVVAQRKLRAERARLVEKARKEDERKRKEEEQEALLEGQEDGSDEDLDVEGEDGGEDGEEEEEDEENGVEPSSDDEEESEGDGQ